MKVKIIKTGEILDLTHRDAQRRVLQGKAYWYSEPVKKIKKKAKRAKVENKAIAGLEHSTEEIQSWGDN